MKILVINGNTSDAMTEDIGMVARMYARPDTEITAISPSFGPRSIEGHFEEYIAAAAVIEEVAKHRDEYDAFILACYSDPGLYACREITDKPVLGIAESSMHLASMLGHKFTIVSVLPRVKPLLENLVRQVGLESKCASVRCTDLTVLEIEEDPDRAVRELTEEARRAVAGRGGGHISLHGDNAHAEEGDRCPLSPLALPRHSHRGLRLEDHPHGALLRRPHPCRPRHEALRA